MKKNKGFAPIIIIIVAVIALLVVGSVAYYVGKNSNIPLKNTDTSTTVQNNNIENNPNIPTTTQTYQNSTYGISFNYPNSWTSSTDTSAIMKTYGLSIPPNANSLITLKVPTTAYPNTDFNGGYFNLSINKQINTSQCLAMNPQNNSTPGQGTTTIEGVTFNWTSEGSAAAGTDFRSTSYSGYSNGICYIFNFGDIISSGAIGMNGITDVGNVPENDVKNILNGVKFTTSASSTTQ